MRGAATQRAFDAWKDVPIKLSSFSSLECCHLRNKKSQVLLAIFMGCVKPGIEGSIRRLSAHLNPIPFVRIASLASVKSRAEAGFFIQLKKRIVDLGRLLY